uniref:Uncharacterized protein n=1 Tax=viral metagenome TaxID=1070528 RepID=A0A6M3ISU1_9ZZZZ
MNKDKKWKMNIKMSYCIKCGAAIATLSVCHACGYIQDAAYGEIVENSVITNW